MSLATRCSSCGTAFRVVQDQLKVSEGWVRCGRCDAVFNALEGLFDLGRDASADAQDRAASAAGDDAHRASVPAALPIEPERGRQNGRRRSRHRSLGHAHEQSEARHSEQQQADPQHGAAHDRPRSPHAELRDRQRLDSRHGEDDDEGPLTAPLELGELLVDPIDAHLFRKRGAEVDRSSSVQLNERDRVEFSDARFDSDLFADSPTVNDPTQAGSPTTAADLPLESAAQQPDFMRRAERRGRWNSGPRRLALVGSLVAASLGLLLQTAHHFRDKVAAQWSIARPVLLVWCKSVGCSVEAPRRIDEVSVEHSDLSRASGADALVLSVTLRSRSSLALGLPSIDLELTDGNGRLVARRALTPRDFGAAGLLQPGTETELQAMFTTGTARVAGYKVELFYP